MRALFYIEQNYAFAILRPLQVEILARGGTVCWFLVGQDVNHNYLTSDEQVLESIESVQQWNPDVVFVPGNYVSNLIPGIKVEIFHGFDSGKVNHHGRRYHFEIRGCFDLYCTHGKSTTEEFLRLKKRYKTFDVVETGWPAVDPLFSFSDPNPFIDASDKRKTILFCSTHSPRFSCAETIFEEIKSLIEIGHYRWLIQFHPMMAIETVEKYQALASPHVDFIETDNVLPLLQAADVMLCDTSAVLLMFMMQHKPVVTFRNQQPDKHLIDIQDITELEGALDTALTMPGFLLDEIKVYCENMHPYRDGHSSMRVIEAVEHMLEVKAVRELQKKPMNWIREFKERRKFRRQT